MPSGVMPGPEGLQSGFIGAGGNTSAKFESFATTAPLNGKVWGGAYAWVRVLTKANPFPVGPEAPQKVAGMIAVLPKVPQTVETGNEVVHRLPGCARRGSTGTTQMSSRTLPNRERFCGTLCVITWPPSRSHPCVC